MREWNELSTSERFELITSIISFISGILIFCGGVYLFFDDIEDFPKSDHGGKFLDLSNPLSIFREKIHHWQIGLFLVFLGLLISLLSLVKMAMILNPSVREAVIEWLRKLEKTKLF